MKLTCKHFALLAGMALGALGVTSAQAQTTIFFSVDMSTATNFNAAGGDNVFVQGTFNNWSTFVQLVQAGTSTVYTNTTAETYALDIAGGTTKFQYVYNDPSANNYFETSADFNLRAAHLPASGNGSVITPTVFYNDAGAPITNQVTFQVDVSQQIALTNFVAGVNTVEVQGNFNGWTTGAGTLSNNPAILRTNQYGLVTSNVYVGTFPVSASPNAAIDYKFVIQPGGHYESPNGTNLDNGGNRFFQNSAPLTLPVVDYSDAAYAPLVKVTFQVDMSAVLLGDPGYDPTSVTVNGDFNSWSSGLPLTNNPAAANTNIFSTTIVIGAGSAINYQYRYLSSGNTVYDAKAGGGNRYYLAPSTNSVIPTVFFNDVAVSDLLNTTTVVTFTVNMTNAVGTDAYVFNQGNGDSVFINGDFLGWPSWNPLALSASQMSNNPPGSILYQYQYTFPAGHSRSVTYKYSINGNDDEAGFGQNHVRYIRSTNGVYNMPLDTFGHPTVEPKFGNLAISGATGSVIPLTWLGYPNVSLQRKASLQGGTWTNVSGTTGQSSATVPNTGASGYFRLVQPQN